mmetsp:Transcript_26699/g.35576  ORF Transcript_26699/g.35576 Transcript_26699/m.35576 type:complete len:95 (-) Transcript_26699:1042-1326(-)
MASISASVVSRSRWLVGSSRISMWGLRYMAQARQSRHFCPPDIVCIFCFGRTSPPRPKLARYLRNSSACAFPLSPGYRSSIVCIGVPSGSSCSS